MMTRALSKISLILIAALALSSEIASAVTGPNIGTRARVSQAPAPNCEAEFSLLKNSDAMKGAMLCANDQVAITSYQQHCVVQKSKRSQIENDVLKYTHAQILFDRELMLMTRLKPVAAHMDKWDAFRKKWTLRLKQNPDLLRTDQSLVLHPETRGTMQMRIDSIDASIESARAVDFKYQEAIKKARGTGFYLFAAKLMIVALSTDTTLQAYADEMGDADAAKELIKSEKDMIYMLFPELESHAFNMDVFANAFFRNPANSYQQSELGPQDALAKDLLQYGENGLLLPIQDRFDLAINLVNKKIDDELKWGELTQARDYLEEEITRDMTEMQNQLDDAFNASLRDPKSLHGYSFVLATAMANVNPDPVNSLILQDYQATQCTAMYSDIFWEDLNGKINFVSDAVMNASLIAFVFGGAEVLVGGAILRFVGTKLMGRAFMLVNLMRSSGAKLLSLSGTALIAAGGPSAIYNLNVYMDAYRRTAREFYENPNFSPDTGHASQMQGLNSNITWKKLEIFMYFSPLFFTRPVTRLIPHG